MSARLLGLAWLVLSLAVACSRPGLQLGEGCQINSDCSDPLICLLGACRRQCAATRDCGAGLQCVRAEDSPSGGVCQLDDEAMCLLTSECGNGLVCQNGTCTTQCNDDRDCVAGAVCTTDAMNVQACYDTGVQPCVYNSDCPDPMICAPDQTCRLECVADRDCIAPRYCAGNLCVLRDAGLADGGT